MLHPREIMWRRTMDQLSLEKATVSVRHDGADIAGTVLVAEAGAPLQLDYSIVCDQGWRTRFVEATQGYRGERRTVRLEHDGEGHWRRDGLEAPNLAGCIDVDLGLSPSTNALPINRLRLHEGASARVRAAWMRFPSLEVASAEQSYERLDQGRYRYRSLSSGFETIISVDDGGFPKDYAGVWRRVGEGPVAPGSGTKSFTGALLSPGPNTELGRSADDFGWLVGGWDATVRDFDGDKVLSGQGEWWFAWVLEGRAIQDVWISPRRGERAGPRGSGAAFDRYGTTVRWFKQKEDLWHISWVNPVSGVSNILAGKRQGDRFVLLGDAAGTPIRWSFTEITTNSFLWKGESQKDDKSWHLDAEFRLNRIAGT